MNKKFREKKFSGLSLHWNNEFIRNIIIVIGIVMVWRGAWALLDMYLFPTKPFLSAIISIIIGAIILYLPDGSLKDLGGYETRTRNRKDIFTKK